MKQNYIFKFLMIVICTGFSFNGFSQLYTYTTHTFTPCGATGQNGPNLAACTAAYASETWSSDPSFFNMTTNGIQEWTVPATGNYSIEAFGAQGGDDIYTAGPSTGGLGAQMYGEFALTEGQILYILVGQEGGNTLFTTIDNAAAGGGGGSFVWDPTDLTAPLIAAGGGGGGSSNGTVSPGIGANATMDGNDAEFVVNAGTGGNGGLGNTTGCSYWAGAGAGWLTDGTGGNNGTTYDYTAGPSSAEGGRAPQNGGIGGTRWIDGGGDEGGDGGFGGGGGGGSDNMGAGGGGGYSGGGGDRGCTYGDGGGGGSFNAGTAQVNTPAANTGEGYIIITQLCTPLTTSVSDDTVCVGDSVTLSATSTGTGTISWDGGVTDSVAFTPPTGSTTYTATSSDPGDCPFSVTIFVGDFPTVDAGTDLNVCEGDSAMLAGTGTATDWSWDGGILDGINFLPPAGTTTYTLTGTIDSTGCQATDMVDVTVVVVDVSVTATGTTLMANQAAATYQWVDCPALTAIAGETNQSFTPSADGDYAVIVDLGGCIDTSACQGVYAGISDYESSLVKLYPNPTNGYVQIQAAGFFNYAVTNVLGEVVLSGSATDQEELNIENQARGAYFVKVISEGTETTMKLIKQ